MLSAEQKMAEVHNPTQQRPNVSLSLSQLQQLVALLNRSDIAELEVNRASEGLHLTLRKLKAAEPQGERSQGANANTQTCAEKNDAVQPPADQALHLLKASMVGTFRSQGKTLVAPGDFVKAGQLIGTIEMLTILNELKTTVSGQVIDVIIQDGQSVEYGQTLLKIDTSATC